MAQLGARFHGMEEVIGSIPIRSTNTPSQMNAPGLPSAEFGVKLERSPLPVRSRTYCAVQLHRGRLKSGDQRDASDQQQSSESPKSVDRVGLHAEPTKVVDHKRRD